MKLPFSNRWMWVLCAASVGCGGSVDPSDGGNAGNPGGGAGGVEPPASGGSAGTGNGGSGGSGGARVPLKHRETSETCDDLRPPGDTCQDCGQTYGDCAEDADCTAGGNGRCESFRGYMECTYDECFSDSDCAGTGPCGCESAFWSDANACLEGNCRTDADCGAGGYCSPSFGECGNYSGVVGYYCHAADDECVDDEDCTQGGPGYCMYSPQVSHWICSTSHCVG